jgi:nucleosome binding factor SPN SPT16 subunit
LGPKNDRKLKDGMTLNVVVGFDNLENVSSDPRNAKYALLLGDTVYINGDNCSILTKADRELSLITYTFGDDEEEDDETKVIDALPKKRGAVLESQLRNTDDRISMESKRKAHQQALVEKLHQEGLEKYAGGGGKSEQKATAVFKKFECYRKDVPLPKEAASLKAIIDLI